MKDLLFAIALVLICFAIAMAQGFITFWPALLLGGAMLGFAVIAAMYVER